MPISDLSLVSAALRDLLDNHINNSINPGSSDVDVLLGYPEDRSGAQRTINLHLYHVAEDPFNKNVSGAGNDANQVATTPMSLSLYYLMTAHHGGGTTQARVEQEILGYALKTLHDFAVIDADSVFLNNAGDEEPVLKAPLDTGTARLEVILRPLTPEDALSYWASEQQQAVRLAAYYEVRLVQLEPERPKSANGIVLRVGQWVGPTVDVKISRSQSSMLFRRPDIIASTLPAVIDISPARAFIDQPSFETAFPDTNRMLIFGQNMAAGIGRRLLVAHDDWAAKGVPGGEIALEEGEPLPADTDVWLIAFESTHVDVGIARSIAYEDASGVPQTIDMVPGNYRAAVEIVQGYNEADGREIARRSEWADFTVAARIVADADVGGGRFDLTLSPNSAFDLAEQEVELTVDGQVYERVDDITGVSGDPSGQFDATGGIVRFQALFDTALAATRPVRITVNGIDAQPYWIQLP